MLTILFFVNHSVSSARRRSPSGSTVLLRSMSAWFGTTCKYQEALMLMASSRRRRWRHERRRFHTALACQLADSSDIRSYGMYLPPSPSPATPSLRPVQRGPAPHDDRAYTQQNPRTAPAPQSSWLDPQFITGTS